METFRELVKLITPENFAMVVTLFLLTKVSFSLDKLTRAIEAYGAKLCILMDIVLKEREV